MAVRGPLPTRPLAINNRGQAVGIVWGATGFLWQAGSAVDLGEWPAINQARAVNDAGQVAGSSYYGPQYVRSHAVLWQNGTMVELGVLDPNGNSDAHGINSQG